MVTALTFNKGKCFALHMGTLHPMCSSWRVPLFPGEITEIAHARSHMPGLQKGFENYSNPLVLNPIIALWHLSSVASQPVTNGIIGNCTYRSDFHVYIYITYVLMYVRTYIRTDARMHAWMYAWMDGLYVCMDGCMDVCMHVCRYAYSPSFAFVLVASSVSEFVQTQPGKWITYDIWYSYQNLQLSQINYARRISVYKFRCVRGDKTGMFQPFCPRHTGMPRWPPKGPCRETQHGMCLGSHDSTQFP